MAHFCARLGSPNLEPGFGGHYAQFDGFSELGRPLAPLVRADLRASAAAPGRGRDRAASPRGKKRVDSLRSSTLRFGRF